MTLVATVRLSAEAERAYRGFPSEVRLWLANRLRTLQEHPDDGDLSWELLDLPHVRWSAVGNWFIIFAVNEGTSQLTVLSIQTQPNGR